MFGLLLAAQQREQSMLPGTCALPLRCYELKLYRGIDSDAIRETGSVFAMFQESGYGPS